MTKRTDGLGLPSAALFSPLQLDGLDILLVEDDADVREALEALLADEGAVVTAVAAAEPALRALADPDATFDLLFSDVMLGGPLTGYDVAAAALQQHPGIAIVLASGYAAPAGPLPASVAAVASLLAKPFRRSDMFVAIATARDPRRVAA